MIKMVEEYKQSFKRPEPEQTKRYNNIEPQAQQVKAFIMFCNLLEMTCLQLEMTKRAMT